MRQSNDLDLTELYKLVRQKRKVLIFIPVLCSVCVLIYVLTGCPPSYQSTAVLYLMPQVSDTGEVDYSSQQANTKLAANIVSLVMQDAVLDPVVEKSDLDTTDELRKILKAVNPEGTELIEITVVHKDPLEAKQLTQAVSESLISVMSDRIHLNNLMIISDPVISDDPVFPDYLQVLVYTIAFCLIADFLYLYILYFSQPERLRDVYDIRIYRYDLTKQEEQYYLWSFLHQRYPRGCTVLNQSKIFSDLIRTQCKEPVLYVSDHQEACTTNIKQLIIDPLYLQESGHPPDELIHTYESGSVFTVFDHGVDMPVQRMLVDGEKPVLMVTDQNMHQLKLEQELLQQKRLGWLCEEVVIC